MERRQARAVLGLRPNFTPQELEDSFRRIARTAHPDAGGDVGRFQELVDARRTLACAPAAARIVFVDNRPRLRQFVVRLLQRRRWPGSRVR